MSDVHATEESTRSSNGLFPGMNIAHNLTAEFYHWEIVTFLQKLSFLRLYYSEKNFNYILEVRG